MKKALITGIAGQDGAWLAQLLLEKGYKVYGGARRRSSNDFERLQFLGIKEEVEIVDFDLLDYSNMYQVIQDIMPDEVYNLAAQSFVGVSFRQPISTSQINGMGVAYLLDIIKTLKPDAKFYQASTSELFGEVHETPQKETTYLHPRSPYGIAKLYAHWMTINYRESYDMYTACGILFNHESELRGEEFVTRKITKHVARHHAGDKKPLEIGNMDAKRDWGYAKEYVEGMYKMLQQDKGDVYVLATGVTTTIREFIEYSFAEIDVDVNWEGEGVNEKGFDKDGNLLVQVNPKFFRPAEVELLLGDPSKANKELDWVAETDVRQLASLMVKSDVDNT